MRSTNVLLHYLALSEGARRHFKLEAQPLDTVISY